MIHGSSIHIYTLFIHECCKMTHSQGLRDCRHFGEAGEGVDVHLHS